MFSVLLLGAAMTVSASDGNAKAKFEARQSLKAGDYKNALKWAETAVTEDPKDPEAYFLRGEANGHSRNTDAAIKDFEKCLELDPKFDAAINQRGGERFKKGDIKGSIADFEAFIKIRPEAYDDHWRYGISLYYDGRFADGAKQFKAGEKAFGNDVENAFFHYICNARSEGVEKARKNILVIGPDRRVPMMKIYDLIKGVAKPDDVIKTAEEAKLEGDDKTEALFYAHLYVGLNYEAEGDAEKALKHLEIAVERHKISHYMWDVGNVHLKLSRKQ
jgi:lipoprotein NlpI